RAQHGAQVPGDGGQEEEDCSRCFRQQHSSSPPAAPAVPASPAVPAEAAAVPASTAAAGRSGPEVTGTSGSCCSTSTAGSTSGSSYRTAGSSSSSRLLSLQPTRALRQRLPQKAQAGQQGRPAQPRAPAQGRVNHVMAKSAAEAPNVVIGTFMVNSHPATVLFDTGATHPFITKSYVEEHSFFTTALRKSLLVSSPGGELRYHIVCPRVSVAIRGAMFIADLRVLDTKGIDVILGMNTLAKWGVRIDCAHRAVHLTASDGQEVTVSASEPSGFLHQIEARPTDGIRVLSEFPDV